VCACVGHLAGYRLWATALTELHGSVSDSIISICCVFVVQHVVRQVHNRRPQQVVRQTASLTTSWTTCRTASPQQIQVASCMQQSASLTTSRTTSCTTNPQLVEVVESDT